MSTTVKTPAKTNNDVVTNFRLNPGFIDAVKEFGIPRSVRALEIMIDNDKPLTLRTTTAMDHPAFNVLSRHRREQIEHNGLDFWPAYNWFVHRLLSATEIVLELENTNGAFKDGRERLSEGTRACRSTLREQRKKAGGK